METNKPLKKTKKVMLIVFLVLISISVLSPIVYKVFMPKYGRLIYNVNPSMATLSGDFASLGIHNKTDTTVSLIGKNGTKGKEVSVQEKMGYAFLGWDDGLMSHNRIDYYDGGVKEYKAVCDFYANEIPNVVFMSDYGNDRTNFKAVIYYGDIVENENIGAVSFITDYENYQGQSKKNFLLHSTSGGFFNKGYLKAYSLFYDKTCLRQLFAISLYNNIFDEKIKYEIASVYFNYEYYGLYVFVDYSFLVNEKPDLIINRSNSKDDKGVNFNNRNYKYIFGTSGLHGDKKLIDVLDSIGSSSGFAFDEESFVRRAVLNTFLNNSSQDENDMIFSIKNNAIKLSPIDSFSLSSGLFKYSNYLPQSDVVYDYFIKRAIATSNIKQTIDDCISNNIEVFRETIETFKDNVSYLQKAITLNNSKYPVKATFSTPDELIGYTYDQYITYFYKWLELRLSYLEGMY